RHASATEEFSAASKPRSDPRGAKSKSKIARHTAGDERRRGGASELRAEPKWAASARTYNFDGISGGRAGSDCNSAPSGIANAKAATDREAKAATWHLSAEADAHTKAEIAAAPETTDGYAASGSDPGIQGTKKRAAFRPR